MPSIKSDSNILIGILGAGQLSRFLCQAASRIGYKSRVLANSLDEPACATATETHVGPAQSRDVLEKFFADCTVVTFENEFADCELLGHFSKSTKFFPNVSAIQLLQNKLTQKQLLLKTGAKTSPCEVWNNEAEFNREFARICALFPNGFVLKWAKNGYDGKGVFILRDVLTADLSLVEKFVLEGKKKSGELFAESCILFQHEAAIVCARSKTGMFASFPLVISVQEKGICKRVFGPAHRLGFDLSLERKAKDIAKNCMDEIGYVGAMAIEFFIEGDNIWVNEIAPRVHNTGHYTLEASETDQFEMHLRAITEDVLPSTQTTPGFAMLNLLGNSTSKEPLDVSTLPRVPQFSTLWYEKTQLRPGRKMGHVNYSGEPDISMMEKKLDLYENLWNEWQKKFSV